MSAFAALMRKGDGLDVAGILENCLVSLAARGPDRQAFTEVSSFGLACCQLQTTYESLFEELPWVCHERELAIVADARLDNREQLITSLGIHAGQTTVITDSQIILSAYDKWERDAASKLRGDFSFVIADLKKRQLYGARDFQGIKPFYYHDGNEAFMACSELRPIADSFTECKEPDRLMMLEFLAEYPIDKTNTLFRGIKRLPPAHYLVVTEKGVRTRRYWEPSEISPIHYKRDAEYSEHFLQLFDRAVEARMRSHLPISAHLSGGLDSSAVVARTASLIRNRNDHPGCSFYTLSFPGQSCDETELADCVAGYCGIETHKLVQSNSSRFPDKTPVKRGYIPPFYPNLEMMSPVEHAMKKAGSRVLLTGMGGDDWFQGNRFRYADMLLSGQWMKIIEQLKELGELSDLLKLRGNPLLGSGLRPIVADFFGRPLASFRPSSLSGRLSAGISPDLVDCYLSSAQAVGENWQGRGKGRFARGGIVRAATGPRVAHVFEMCDLFTAGFRHEWRHPFQDQDLVEFSLAIPESCKVDSGWSKVIIRQAMSAHLPDTILWRPKNINFSPVYADFLGFGEPESIDWRQLELVKQGWFDGDVLESHYALARHQWRNGDSSYICLASDLWNILALSAWFEEVSYGFR